jgi:hypothetical protein
LDDSIGSAANLSRLSSFKKKKIKKKKKKKKMHPNEKTLYVDESMYPIQEEE